MEEKESLEEKSNNELEEMNMDSPKDSSKGTEVKEKSATKNYMYNMIYQVVALIVPLVVTPYISRVLGSNGVGEYSFTYSIISYFVLFGTFGFGYYAQREIARYQNDKHMQSRVFWEILLCRMFTVVLALIVNNVLIFTGLYGEYKLLMIIFNINIVATMIDIAYLYQGNEEFRTIAIINVLVKILGIAAIFIFVKDEDDVWIYTLCNCGILLGSNLCMWFLAHRMLVKVKFKELNVFKHFIPSLRLFIPTIAVSVYTMLDRTLIGLLVDGETTKILADGTEKIVKNSDIQNGYYEQSEKIVKMALTVLTSLGTVMVPKNSYYFKAKNYERVKENIFNAINFVLFLGVPIMFGLMATAQNFSPWFFGDGYDDVPLLIMIFSPLILAIGLNNVFGNQYLLPAGKDNIYTFSVLFGAIINLILNLILIRFYGAVGAAIASVIAETMILLFQMVYLRRVFNYKGMLIPFIKYVLVGSIMFVSVFLLGKYVFDSSIINSFILVGIGAFIYFIILLLIKDKMIFRMFNGVFVILKRSKK